MRERDNDLLSEQQWGRGAEKEASDRCGREAVSEEADSWIFREHS